MRRFFRTALKLSISAIMEEMPPYNNINKNAYKKTTAITKMISVVSCKKFGNKMKVNTIETMIKFIMFLVINPFK